MRGYTIAIDDLKQAKPHDPLHGITQAAGFPGGKMPRLGIQSPVLTQDTGGDMNRQRPIPRGQLHQTRVVLPDVLKPFLPTKRFDRDVIGDGTGIPLAERIDPARETLLWCSGIAGSSVHGQPNRSRPFQGPARSYERDRGFDP